jgi:hypothetical protein
MTLDEQNNMNNQYYVVSFIMLALQLIIQRFKGEAVKQDVMWHLKIPLIRCSSRTDVLCR